MKKLTRVMLGLTFTAVMLYLSGSPAHAGCGCGMASCSGGAENTAVQPVNWYDLLVLSDAQKLRLDQAFQSRRPTMQALAQKRKDLLTQLETLVKANVADSRQVDSVVNDLKKTQDALQQARYAFWKETAGFLTVSQQAKFVLTDSSRVIEATDEIW